MFWFSGGVNLASAQLAETFKRLIPLQQPLSKNGRSESTASIAKKNSEALTDFYESVRAERDRLGLGVLGLARLSFGLQQHLLVVGYPPQLVKQVLFAMLASAFVRKQP